jgi:hypothetical protein
MASATISDVTSGFIVSQEQAFVAARRSNARFSNVFARRSSKSKSNYGSAPPPFNALVPSRPSDRNSVGTPDAVHPKRQKMKKQRKIKTAVAVGAGVVVGGIIIGPVGLVVGGVIGGVAANKLSKAGERRAQRKFERENYQRAAQQSMAVNASFA